MSTSLAEQLQKLRVPQTSLLLQDKKRPSLLFDPREAANLDRETVFNIGKNGLEELIKLSSVFKEFETTIFAQSAINLERSVQDAKVNKRLDAGVEKFLIFLSPYFLLNTAHKALEWLIYRFHIHEFNKDAFLMLILPYHETRMFVRALQLVELKNQSDKWHWLQPLQRPGVPLSTMTLVNRVAVDNALLKLLCNHVVQATTVYDDGASSLSTLYAFYTTAIIGSIERTEKISEVQINYLLPSLVKGLSSTVTDFIAGNYMILVQLSRKTKLTDATVEYLIARALKNPTLKHDLILLICSLYETSNNRPNSIADKIVLRISGFDWFCDEISNVKSHGIKVTKFVVPLVESAIKIVLRNPRENEGIRRMVNDIFQKIRFDDYEVDVILRNTLKPNLISEELNEDGKAFLSTLFNSLEIRYPVQFDEYLKKLMRTSEKKSESKEALQFLTTWHDGIESTKKSMEIFDKLNHYSAEQRIMALECLAASPGEIAEGFQDMVIKSMLDRFNDDDARVVGTLLNFPVKILTRLFPADILTDRLMILLSQCHTEKKNVLAQPAVKLLLELCDDGDDTCVFIATLPYLFPSTESETKIAMQVLDSDFANKNKYLSVVKRDVGRKADAALICSAAFHNILNREILPPTENILTTMKTSYDNDATSLFFNLILLGSVCRVPVGSLPSNLALEVIEMAAEMIKKYPKVASLPDCNQLNGDRIHDGLKLTSRGILPLQAVTYVLEMVHRRLELKANRILDFEANPQTTKLVLRLVEILLDGMAFPKRQPHYSWCLKIFFQRHFPTGEDMLRFLSEFFIKPVNAQTSLHALNVTSKVLAKCDSFQWIFGDRVFLSNFLIALSRHNKQCREAAVDILKRLSQTFNLEMEGCSTLLYELAKRSSEIAMDPDQLSLVLYTLLSPDPDVKAQLKKDIRGKLEKAQEFFFSIISDESTPIHVTSQLLEVLVHVNGPELLKELSVKGLELLEKLENNPKNTDHSMAMALKNILQRFNSTTVGALDDRTVWKFFEAAITNHRLLIATENEQYTPSVILIKQIDHVFFENAGRMSQNLQRKIFALFVDIVTDCEIGSIVAVANRTVRKIVVDAHLVVEELQRMREAKSTKDDGNDKNKSGVSSRMKRRSKNLDISQRPEVINTREWKRGITILEFIQKAVNIKNEKLLMPVLFNLLRMCLNFEEQSPLQYTNQLLLSNIHKLATMNIPVPDPHLQVDLISQCIRTSHNPQTHHHALLVLVELFKVANIDIALHNIMPIFTFMGSSVLRQDDAYSIQIISKTIETIVPIINAADDETHACEILRIFIVSLADIPEHRRIPLFVKLLQLLENHLHLFYLLTFECHVLAQNNILQDKKNSSQRLEFALTISQEFLPKTLVGVCIELVKFIRSLPVELEEEASKRNLSFQKKHIFDVAHNTPKQLRHYKYTTVQFLNALLSSPDFVDKTAHLDAAETAATKPLYDTLLVELVLLIESASKSADLHQGKLKGKYWKVLLHNLCDTLDAINALLPNAVFIASVKKLMNHHHVTVKRKSLELLNNRLQQRKFNEEDYDDLLTLVGSLLETISLQGKVLNQETEVIQQTALITLKLLAKFLASDNPEKFKPVLEIAIEFLKTKEGPLLGSIVLCLAELCGTMRTHVIPYLSKFFPAILKLLKTRCCQESPDVVTISIISALQKIVESIGNFLSLYLEQLLLELCKLSSLYADSDHPKIGIIVSRLKIIRQKLVSCIRMRVLLPAVEKTYTSLLKSESYQCIPVLMAILAESFVNLTNSDLQTAIPDITAFFLRVLQFREDINISDEDEKQQENIQKAITSIEESAGKSLVSLVLKLSEATFRPLYYKLYDWAARNSDKKLRNITFYRLSANIAECLKSLFILFAGHFLKHAAVLLQQNNLSIANEAADNTLENETDRIELIENILTTLHRVFSYDAHNFVNQEKFDILSQPIVDYIEYTEGSKEKFEERSSQLVVPCIASFASAIQDDSLHKQLVYQVLLKTRHNKSHVRSAALSALIEIARKLGEDFMPLLPETVPFLAELLEDEDENTEKIAQNAVRTLEDILGEPLQKYF
ncbi:HEAT repeat-containing protein 1 [Diachasma alloeum]|uniref:HEAT repeat-containing protein 1 n=1 Tax=Diachasma alloeum TaxID=454923 RepID=UPI0007382A31|nr:HEAT repeat-containing protein 1 [Diachasma alloeum]XP_015119213.1 HEAT repeat-containing protein 1 [Diachasma alloeum]